MSGSPILEIDRLIMRFGGLLALDTVSTKVTAGEIRAIIGPNGAGKTTMLNCLTGIYTPTGGEIVLRGKKIMRLPAHQITRLGIARTFQSVRLFSSLSVIENVQVAITCRTKASIVDVVLRNKQAMSEERQMRQEAMDILEFVGLKDKADDQAGSLAAGQRRILEIGRALATRPDILLLDEPAAGLTYAECGELMDQIRAVRDRGVTVILIEHNMRFVMELCDLITVLDFGKKIAEGNSFEIKNNDRVVEAYLGKIDHGEVDARVNH